MRQRLMLVAALAFMLSVTGMAEADPIMGTITLTVAPAPPAYGNPGPGIPTAAVYNSGSVDLSVLPQNLFLTGPPLGFAGGLIGNSINTTFDMKITFDGTSGAQPYVDVKGSLFGYVASVPGTASSNFSGTPTSATLQDWTVGSGVPLGLVNQYLNLSNYESLYQLFAGTAPPQSSSFGLGSIRHRRCRHPSRPPLLVYLACWAGWVRTARAGLVVVLRSIQVWGSGRPLHDAGETHPQGRGPHAHPTGATCQIPQGDPHRIPPTSVGAPPPRAGDGLHPEASAPLRAATHSTASTRRSIGSLRGAMRHPYRPGRPTSTTFGTAL